jgi:hypothetical protein
MIEYGRRIDMENWSEVMQWLTTGGSVALVAWFVSWLVEDYAWWNNFKVQTKKLLILLVALIIGMGAQYIKLHPELIVLIKPYMDSGVLIVVAWVATQIAHKVDKASS